MNTATPAPAPAHDADPRDTGRAWVCARCGAPVNRTLLPRSARGGWLTARPVWVHM